MIYSVEKKKRTRGKYHHDQHIVRKYNSTTLTGGPTIDKPSMHGELAELSIDGKTKK